MTGKWGDDQIGGKDISSVFLVMCNRWVSFLILMLSQQADSLFLGTG
jgi:hypothetical protein